MLHDEFIFFIENQEDLVKNHRGKFIVIKGQSVVGEHNTELEAYTETKKTYPLGTFLIQKCEPGPSAYTAILHPTISPA